MTLLPESAVAAVAAPTAGRERLRRQLLRDPAAVGCLLVLAVIVLLAAAAPLLTSADPGASSLSDTLAPIGDGHPLGADGVGRDVLARLLYGGRVTLLGTLLATVVALAIGVPGGLIAGYFKGWFDAVSSWLANLLMAVPAIILLLVVLAVVGQSTYLAMAVFGVLMAPGVFRLIRASVTAVRQELYVDAAAVSGLSDARIIRRHILPVVQAPTIIQASQMLGVGIIIQAGLEFLGLGSASSPSWGSMLNDAFQNIYTAPLLIAWPGIALAVTVTAFSLLGNAVRDALDGSGSRRPVRRRRGQAKTQVAGPALDPAARASDRAPSVPLGPLTGEELLVVRDLTISYPGRLGRSVVGDSVVVDGVSLAVRRGEVLGLVGESGSGKSQTAFAILGLLPAEAEIAVSGIVFDGQEISARKRSAMNGLRGTRIGYVPQEPMSNLDPSFRIGSQLVEPIRQHLGLSRAAARTRALELLARVGINDPERTFAAYPHEISGGMAQRVLIAGAVSCDPDLLIADEPTTALDVTVQAEVLDLLRSLQAERTMGMILVTHNFGVVADICNQVAVMQSGRIVETASVNDLFANPQDPYTRQLLDSTLDDSVPRRPLAALAAHPEGQS